MPFLLQAPVKGEHRNTPWFRGRIRGNLCEKRVNGYRKSGMQASISGLRMGVEVEAVYVRKTGETVFSVYRTGGTASFGQRKEKLAEVRMTEIDMNPSRKGARDEGE